MDTPEDLEPVLFDARKNISEAKNRFIAALRLGISRSALYAKIQRYGLRQPGVDPDS
jgi:transcriptional regulator of acetoin/glycerol metabolism